MRGLLRILVVLVLVVALAVGALFGWVAWKGRQLRDVAMPADDTPAAGVLAAYVQALDAHDCDTAAELFSEDQSWCGAVDSIRLVGLAQTGTTRTRRHVEAIATLQIKWLPLHGGNVAGSGEVTWRYTLERATRDAPWRIVDQGEA